MIYGYLHVFIVVNGLTYLENWERGVSVEASSPGQHEVFHTLLPAGPLPRSDAIRAARALSSKSLELPYRGGKLRSCTCGPQDSRLSGFGAWRVDRSTDLIRPGCN